MSKRNDLRVRGLTEEEVKDSFVRKTNEDQQFQPQEKLMRRRLTEEEVEGLHRRL